MLIDFAKYAEADTRAKQCKVKISFPPTPELISIGDL